MATIPDTTAEPVTRSQIAPNRSALAIAAFVAVLVGILGYVRFTWNQVSTDDAQVDGRLVLISPKISGYIGELLVDDNQAVTKGQIIARIDSRDEEVKVAQTEAALETAEAKLADTNAELLQAQSAAEKADHADISCSVANVADRKANHERAHSDLLRMQALIGKHEISQLQYDRYVAEESIAKSQLDAALQNLAGQGYVARIADAAVRAAKAKIQEAEAQAAEARANLNSAKLELSYTEIRAPQDGCVTRRTVEMGSYVSPGQTLLTLVPTHDVWVTANFKETQLRNVKAGDRTEVKVDSIGMALPAYVDSVANATGSRLSLLPPENATGNFVKIVQRIPIKIKLDADAVRSRVLAVGTNVEVTIHTH